MKNKINEPLYSEQIPYAEVNKASIKNWSIDDRPREKFLSKGKAAMSDAELLSILINTGTRNKTSLDIARMILSAAGGSLQALSRMPFQQLQSFEGIGKAKAITIQAAIELGNRKQHAISLSKKIINSPQDAFEIIRHSLEDLPHEEFWVLHLNHALNFIKKERISVGGMTSTIVDLRLLSKSCIENLTSNVILCHNHPSGKMLASEADINLTQKIKNALSIFDIHVRDHIIVCGKDYVSFADKGLL